MCIRDRLECIHCALCIDACDEMMKKVGRPTGLIAYDTDTAVACRATGQETKYRLVRPRTVLYSLLIAGIASLMAFGLLNRGTFEVNVLKDRSPPFVRLSNGDVRNGYTLKLVNKSGEAREMHIRAMGIDGLDLEIVGLERETGGDLILPVASHGIDRYRMLVTVPAQAADGREYFSLILTDTRTGEVHANRTSFMAAGD